MINNKHSVRIAIVGASIAGTTTGILLQRSGYDVTIYEQNPKGLVDDRGAGIAMPKDLVRRLISLDLLDKNFATINVNDRIFFRYDNVNDKEIFITTEPFYASAVHWGSLYSNLSKRLDEKRTFFDTRVTGISQDKRITLSLSNGTKEEFDIVIFADGYGSLGRKFLFPDSMPNYTGYIAWRGMLRRVDEESSARLKDSVPFYLYEKGHLLIYAIPRLNTNNPNEEYTINWLIYENIDANHPLHLDNKDKLNVTPDKMTANYIEYLHALVTKYFPKFPRDIVLQTQQPFTQAIYDAYVPHYFHNNIALIGDSSILVRPHVGAGSTKAIEDALSLNSHLNVSKDVYAGMRAWGIERRKVANNLLVLCRDLGDFLVSQTPDWGQYDAKLMNARWEKIVDGHENWYQIIPR